MALQEPPAILSPEDHLTDAELAAAEDALTARAEQLRAQLTDAETELGDRITDSVADAPSDLADQGSNAEAFEQEALVTHHVEELLRQTEHALSRIAAGCYSSCEACGGPIGRPRLVAFPRATMCLNCKQDQRS